MFIIKFAGKILLLPVWLILFVIGLAVKMTVQTLSLIHIYRLSAGTWHAYRKCNDSFRFCFGSDSM